MKKYKFLLEIKALDVFLVTKLYFSVEFSIIESLPITPTTLTLPSILLKTTRYKQQQESMHIPPLLSTNFKQDGVTISNNKSHKEITSKPILPNKT